MGKDASEKKIKKDKKEKKEKRSEVDGVVKSSKKDKKSRRSGGSEIANALEVELAKESENTLIDESGDVVMNEGDAAPVQVLSALVPFANPLVEDSKDVKKLLKGVKKSAKTKTLRRGVKEVVKALRKSPTSAPSSSDIANPSSIVIIAADISPMDVISHIPVLCEDHNIPYVYIRHRAELGEASATKRPTSVVMVTKDRVGKKAKEAKEDDKSDFDDAYAEAVKVVIKASKTVRK